MSVLLMRLSGAMQSWGTKSRFYDRDTEDFPSKSGILGIIGAALGRDRAENISDLCGLNIGVRILTPGKLTYDYQVAGVDGFYRASGSVERKSAVPYTKHYIADADFLVGLEGDETLLKEIEQALKKPYYPLFLGRKSYVPNKPVYVINGFQTGISLYKSLRDFQYHSEIDEQEIKRLKWELFDSNIKIKIDFFDEAPEYIQTFIFDSEYMTSEREQEIGCSPVLITKLQDEPLNFLSRSYLIREIKMYRLKYNTETELNYLIPKEEGGSNVSE